MQCEENTNIPTVAGSVSSLNRRNDLGTGLTQRTMGDWNVMKCLQRPAGVTEARAEVPNTLKGKGTISAGGEPPHKMSLYMCVCVHLCMCMYVYICLCGSMCVCSCLCVLVPMTA